jgi:hypothetical protein
MCPTTALVSTWRPGDVFEAERELDSFTRLMLEVEATVATMSPSDAQI